MISPYAYPGIRREDVPHMPVQLITADSIIEAVCYHFKISSEFVKSKRRAYEQVYPRQLSMYLIRQNISGMPLTAIGKLFGSRDHTTVIHSISKIIALLSIGEEKVRADLVRIKMLL